jgi:predicted nucleotidyltransferase
MSRATVEMVNDTVLYNGRSLAEWVPDVADRIFRRCHATRIVIFGSVARGDDGIDSDIDLLVVLPKVTNRHDDAVAVLRELRDMPVPIDVLVFDQAALDRESQVPGIVRVALREGRTLECSR